ncbi:NAD(P)-binding protein [Actinomadura opuntiae]|uniref:NAD(P)-binding protein n=1 Tax=Actinomadura sp. OS1-43 TaxID=604315 RepID=UPI00255AA606|nr:NAD(P)-binding protein [Actinomadura sp. OS1-43]MDL4819322.1 NAD(P)-binding protein [Actinomadura sp. OS1-43]
MKSTITVIGGGLAGLTAAIASAEQGVDVVLFEAHQSLGGRARCSPAPYVANDGPHAFYKDGTAWRWLAARGLTRPAARLGVAQLARVRFRHGGGLKRCPPAGLVGMLTAGRGRRAPVDRSFRDWAGAQFGTSAYRAAAGLLGPALFEADPGRLSAAFVFERLLRVGSWRQPVTRYPVGGWGALVDRMAARARHLGVRIETGARLDAIPTAGPVIVATSLDAARGLLGDGSLRWESGRCVLLDVALRCSRADQCVTFDLQDGGFVEQFGAQDPSLAPPGETLVQGSMPLWNNESKSDGLRRLEALYDLCAPGWRGRLTWRRDQIAVARTGALDLPGTTWRDRPAINRGENVYLTGDAVAAPGLLAEVSVNSALIAARLATAN